MRPPAPLITLDTGVRLRTLPGPSPATAVVAVHVRSGFRTGPVGPPGPAHFFDHRLFERAAGFADGSFLAAQSKVGGQAATHTRHDYTKFFAIIPRGYLDHVLELEGNRFLAEPLGADTIHNRLTSIHR